MFRFQSAGIRFSRTYGAESRFAALVRWARSASRVTVNTSGKDCRADAALRSSRTRKDVPSPRWCVDSQRLRVVRLVRFNVTATNLAAPLVFPTVHRFAQRAGISARRKVMLGRLFPFRQISGEFGLNVLFCPSFALPASHSVSILTPDPHPLVRQSRRKLEADGISARYVSLAV